MVEADDRAAAQLAYQRALAALHEARSALADLAAARRRFAFDRVRLAPAAAGTRSAELKVAHAELLSRADQLRDLAAGLRAELRHLTDELDDEPDEVPEDPAGSGYQQPPFESDP